MTCWIGGGIVLAVAVFKELNGYAGPSTRQAAEPTDEAAASGAALQEPERLAV